MSKQAIKEGNLTYYFDNLPDGIKLRFQDSKRTLSLVPSNFAIMTFEPPQVVVEEEEDKTSLLV